MFTKELPNLLTFPKPNNFETALLLSVPRITFALCVFSEVIDWTSCLSRSIAVLKSLLTDKTKRIHQLELAARSYIVCSFALSLHALHALAYDRASQLAMLSTCLADFIPGLYPGTFGLISEMAGAPCFVYFRYGPRPALRGFSRPFFLQRQGLINSKLTMAMCHR